MPLRVHGGARMTHPGESISAGQRWVPLDRATKAEAFVVYQVGGLNPEHVFGHYHYANGRTRQGTMLRSTLVMGWCLQGLDR